MRLSGNFAASVWLAAAMVICRSALATDFTVPDLKLPTVTRISDGAAVSPASIAANSSGLDAIGVPAMRSQFPQITGAGQTVVVIDTGIDYTHPALASGFINGFHGLDFGSGDLDPMDDWAGGGGHGTHVAGIIVSTDAAHQGVAPGANIISLKVFNSTTGVATDPSILDALNWVSLHQAQYNITTVNMSLGDGVETTLSKIPAGEPFNAAMGVLKNQGIFVSVASGNDSYLNGQSMPAASKNAVSVGATYASNDWSQFVIAYNDPSVLDPYPQLDPITGLPAPARDLDYGPVQNDIAFFTDRYKTATDGQTDLMAPGIFITSTVPLAFDDDGVKDGFADMAGTSMAAPQVAGAAMLVRQALEEAGTLDPDPSRQVDQILSILESTGTPLFDYFYIFGGNNSTIMEIPAGSGNYYWGRGTFEDFPLINVDAAIESILPEPTSLSLLAVGAGGLLLRRRRSR